MAVSVKQKKKTINGGKCHAEDEDIFLMAISV